MKTAAKTDSARNPRLRTIQKPKPKYEQLQNHNENEQKWRQRVHKTASTTTRTTRRINNETKTWDTRKQRQQLIEREKKQR